MLNILISPIQQLLIFFYSATGENFGLAIIALTLVVRGVLVPITIPSLKSAKKMQELKPHIDKLKKKHKDKTKLQQAQMELYKQHGVNPTAGCLPQIAQLLVLIALYRVFIDIINSNQLNGQSLHTNFFWLDLSKPDPYYILPLLAGFAQLIFSFMMKPGLEHHQNKAKQKKPQDKPQDQMEMAQSIQQQMMYLMPAMTVIIALKFPSGLALYWVVTTLFSLIQQYVVSGPGGLLTIYSKLTKKQI